jgi:hypothetical protein
VHIAGPQSLATPLVGPAMADVLPGFSGIEPGAELRFRMTVVRVGSGGGQLVAALRDYAPAGCIVNRLPGPAAAAPPHCRTAATGGLVGSVGRGEPPQAADGQPGPVYTDIVIGSPSVGNPERFRAWASVPVQPVEIVPEPAAVAAVAVVAAAAAAPPAMMWASQTQEEFWESQLDNPPQSSSPSTAGTPSAGRSRSSSPEDARTAKAPASNCRVTRGASAAAAAAAAASARAAESARSQLQSPTGSRIRTPAAAGGAAAAAAAAAGASAGAATAAAGAAGAAPPSLSRRPPMPGSWSLTKMAQAALLSSSSSLTKPVTIAPRTSRPRGSGIQRTGSPGNNNGSPGRVAWQLPVTIPQYHQHHRVLGAPTLTESSTYQGGPAVAFEKEDSGANRSWTNGARGGCGSASGSASASAVRRAGSAAAWAEDRAASAMRRFAVGGDLLAEMFEEFSGDEEFVRMCAAVHVRMHGA